MTEVFISLFLAIFWGYTLNVFDVIYLCSWRKLKNVFSDKIKAQSILSVFSLFGIGWLVIENSSNFTYFSLIVFIEILLFKNINRVCVSFCRTPVRFVAGLLSISVMLCGIAYYTDQLNVAFLYLFIFFFLLRNNRYSHHYIKKMKEIAHAPISFALAWVFLMVYSYIHYEIKEVTYALMIVSVLITYLYIRRSKVIYQFESMPSVNVELELDDLPDFSYAGYGYGRNAIPPSLETYNVSDYGIFPDNNLNQIVKIQKLVDRVGENGGGILFFPSGQYILRSCEECAFVRINYSNIIIRGEIIDHKIVTEFISTEPTLQGEKNPWLSPFLFTTGESLQKSNIFWGVQFKKKKDIITKSGSMTDPGSDGSILEPSLATTIEVNMRKGTKTVTVSDSSKINSKFILICLFNSSSDGDLIKEILNHDKLDISWGTALRAGEEIAPSLQWLVEIDKIIDIHTIELKQPLRWNIDLKYSPSIYNVEMLSNIGFRDIIIKSTWSGLFRHHGEKGYYDPKFAQTMDYGWNGINMKRVAHGFIDNIILDNFTNPLYIQDSRNITVERVVIKGADGHQGLKIYGHACDNLFKDIKFYNHYADFIGGETCSYGNVFTGIHYLNPENKYVDFDFHGFSEGPFSPPMQNLFECCTGIRGIKGAGAAYNVPSAARDNVFWNIYEDGYNGDDELFAFSYCSNVTNAIKNIKKCIRSRSLMPLFHIKKSESYHIPTYSFFCKSYVVGYSGNYRVSIDKRLQINDKYLYSERLNEGFVSPFSLYNYQKNSRDKAI